MNIDWKYGITREARIVELITHYRECRKFRSVKRYLRFLTESKNMLTRRTYTTIESHENNSLHTLWVKIKEVLDVIFRHYIR